jgi:hypothetical protein
VRLGNGAGTGQDWYSRASPPAAAQSALGLPVVPGIYWLAWEEPVRREAPIGIPVANLAEFDRLMTTLMSRWQIPRSLVRQS